jgi:hypothetical protein
MKMTLPPVARRGEARGVAAQPEPGWSGGTERCATAAGRGATGDVVRHDGPGGAAADGFYAPRYCCGR